MVLEYIYKGNSEQYSSANVKFRKITNGYTGVNTLLNDKDSFKTTHNVSDNNFQSLSDGKLVLLDDDSGYYYPAYDSNILVDDLTISPNITVSYDTVRVHILSGYNFQDCDGFQLNLSALMNNNKELYFTSNGFLKSDTNLLYFNPKPIKLSDFVYDKYYELKIPSLDFIITQQENNPTSTTTSGYKLTNGVLFANQKTLYCEFKTFEKTEIKNGILYATIKDSWKFPFDAYDKFDLLVADINMADDGDYFEFNASYDGNIIENFMYSINSLAGNRFYLIHEIRVIEQVGTTFFETSSFSTIQTSDYGKPLLFRPILQLADSAVSFSLEYTMRLYNKDDGKSTFKTSSITSYDVNKFGKKVTKLNVGNVDTPHRIYNKLEQAPVYEIKDNTISITKTDTVVHYVNSNDMVIKVGNDMTPDSNISIDLHPFMNILTFHILKKQSNSSNTQIYDLDTIGTYKMSFIKPDNSKLYIDEFVSQSFLKTNGDIAFKISESQIVEIATYTNKNFYIISLTPEGEETVLGKGVYTVNL